MNIEAVELEENCEPTRFCGPNLLSPYSKGNAKLARGRYVERFPHMFAPMEPKERVQHFEEHCAQIETDRVVCYRKYRTDGINMGGKRGIHLQELLFPASGGSRSKTPTPWSSTSVTASTSTRPPVRLWMTMGSRRVPLPSRQVSCDLRTGRRAPGRPPSYRTRTS